MPVYLILDADGELLAATLAPVEADYLRRLLGGERVEVRWP